jgi:chromosomal replication initiator protein
MQKNLWGKVLTKLEKQINRPSFNTWLRPTFFVSMDQKNVHIGVPNEVFIYWLGEHYVNVIGDALTEVLGFVPEIFFVVRNANAEVAVDAPVEDVEKITTSPQMDQLVTNMESTRERRSATLSQLAITPEAVLESITALKAPPVKAVPGLKGMPSGYSPRLPDGMHGKPRKEYPSRQSEGRGHIPDLPPQERVKRVPSSEIRRSPETTQTMNSNSLNSAYNFDSYIVGSSNRFAHAAALAVAEQMAENYNPLFVYGGVGLGKTHLLHAIGNQLLALRPNSRVLYLSSEQFINELVVSIRGDRMAWFREKYRNIDLFLVDDIQFIARKERTQEEFFHTFNTLYQARKQIVLTSDSPPKKIPTIAEQLRSRFEWGLIADIQAPDLETRIAILKKKAEVQGLDLPDDVAIYIASQVKSNIRELEGCLSKIQAYSLFGNHKISLELAKKVLLDMFDAPSARRVTVDLVQRVVANHYQVTPSDLKSSMRNRKVTLPRQVAMYLVREMTNLSLPDIGRKFGGRDHTTVMHACKRVEQNQGKDLELQENLLKIRELIQT